MVNTTTTPTTGTTPALTQIGHILRERVALAPKHDPIQRQAAIENALCAALHLVRTSDTAEALQRATGRAIRAASMLKQACADLTTSEVAV